MNRFEFAGPNPGRAASRMASILLVFVLAISVSPIRAGEPPARRILTLDEAITLAGERNETYLMAQENEVKASGAVKEARAGALPNIQLQGTYQNNFKLPAFFAPEAFGGGKVEIGSDLEVNGQVRLDQVLYAFGRVGNAIRFAKIYRDMASLQAAGTWSQVVFATRQAYYRVLLAAKVADIQRQSLEQARSHLADVEKKHANGTASRFELLRARVEVKNREPGMISAENDAVLSMQDLKRILALEKEPDPVLSDTLFYRTLEVTEENAVKEALANRPDILALEQNVEGQEKLLSIRNAEKFPVLGLYGQVVFQGEAGRARPLDPFDSEHRAVSSAAGVALTIPLFDGFRTKGKIEQARADLRSARLQLEEETHSVRLETTKAVKELESLRRAYEAQVATVGLAEEAYRIAETRYQSGISTQLELTDARIALDEARTNYASTLYSYDVAVANLERILGRTTRDEVAPFTNGRGGEEE